MVPNVLATTAVLRRHYRRLGSMGLLGLVAALGLVPVALYMPRTDGPKYVLLSLVCLYAGRKIVQAVRARSAVKQLSMEEHFLKYGSSEERVQKCVQHDDHMWQQSRIVEALKNISTHRLPTTLLADEKRLRIYRHFRATFRSMLPRLAIVDIGLVAAVGIGLALAPTITVNFHAVLFQAGFLAIAVAGTVEVSRWVVNRQLSERLDRWFGGLSDWTVREGLDTLYVQTGAYSHRLLYFTQPWFADGTEDEAEESEYYVVAGDGQVLPSSISRADEPD